MKKILSLSLVATVTGCAGFLEASPQRREQLICVVNDDKLSVPLTDPKRAKVYLEDLAERLAVKDPAALVEAADLVARISNCIKEK